MDVLQIEYKAMVAENKELSAKLLEMHDLRAAFLENVVKLGIVCSKLGIDARLPQTETKPFFSFAVDERLKRDAMVRQELATARAEVVRLTPKKETDPQQEARD